MAQVRKYTRKYLSANLLLAVVLFLLCFISCKDDNGRGNSPTERDFLEKQDTGLFGYGGFLFKYSPENCQISFNRKRRQLRLQNDSQSGYLNVIFGKFPSDGETETEVEIRYKSGGDEIVHSEIMEILENNGNKIWLWDRKNKLGVILPVLWHKGN